MLIRLENGIPTGHPVDDYNFRTLHPGVSFPRYLSPDDVEPLGFGLYEFSQIPETPKYKKVVEETPVKKENGIWCQQWNVVDMNAEEKLTADAARAEEVRLERSSELAASDWTQLPDSPVNSAAWLVYRQELRDVPAQSGFPWEVSWPEPPA
jgi:hypothetical protein